MTLYAIHHDLRTKLQEGLRHFGLAPLRLQIAGNRTLASVLNDALLRPNYASMPAIINTTGHFQVVQGRRFIDNRTRGTVALSDALGRRQRVDSMITLQLVDGASPFAQEVASELAYRAARRSESTSEAGCMAKARRLASQHGITLERDERYYWVTEPRHLAHLPELRGPCRCSDRKSPQRTA